MQDAVDLIGKYIVYGGKKWTINKIYFIPNAVHIRHNYYFGLKSDKDNMLNVSYTELLPFIKEQIKL